MAGKFEI